MSALAENLARIHSRILAACRAAGRSPADVRLLPVTKTQPLGLLHEALVLGLGEFGENRVQELADKAAALQSEPVRWHLIGSLQTNKVKELLRVPALALVHSLDRNKLADVLQRELAAQQRVLDVLVQVHATGEVSKHGVGPEQVLDLLTHVQSQCPNLCVRGLMALGPLASDPVPVFTRVASLRRELEQQSGRPLPILSMGMSGDLEAAIAHGSTLVRIGSGVFGPRRA